MGNSGFGAENERKSKRTKKFDIRHNSSTLKSFPKQNHNFNTKDDQNYSNERNFEKPILKKTRSLFFKEESHDTGSNFESESDDNPPLQSKNYQVVSDCSQDVSLFEFPALRFAKVISQKDENSLLDESNGSYRDMIKEAMSEFDTKCSKGQPNENHGDSDILSASELQNTIPFCFSGLSSSANSSRFIKCTSRGRISI